MGERFSAGRAGWWKDKRFGIGFALVVLAVVSVPAYLGYRDHGGQLAEVFFYDLGAAPHALAIDKFSPEGGVDSIGFPYSGLSVIDLGTGAVKRRRVVREAESFLGVTGDLLWFGAGAPVARDGERLEDVVPAGQAAGRIVANSPSVRGVARLEVDSDSARLLATSSDGYRYWVDPKTFAATRAEPSARVAYHRPTLDRPSADLRGGQALSLQGSPRSVLHLARRGDAGLRGGPIGADSYLGGAFVCDSPSGRAIELDRPPSVLIAHQDVMGDDSRFRLSRVALDGRALWTITQEQTGIARGVLLSARLLADRVVLFTQGDQARGGLRPESPSCAFAISAEGKVLWRTAF